MHPCISIILPVFNRAHVLEECIQSVFSQSFQNYEIILIDDGSTDDTLSLCHQLAQQDPRIRVLESPHMGVSAARNLGLDIASGDYLFFLDSDDVIHPLLLETLYQGMVASGAEMSGSDIMNIHQRSWHKLPQHIQNNLRPAETTYLTNCQALHTVFHERTPFGQIGGTMILRTLIGRTRFRTDLIIGEDFYFLYENLIKGANVLFLQPKWYYCRIHPHNSSNNFSFDAFWSRFYRRQLVWESEESLGRTENAKRQKADALYCCLSGIIHTSPGSDDLRKIRKTMRSYQKILIPACSFRHRLQFYLALFFPRSYRFVIPKLKKYIKQFTRKL